MKKIHPYDAYLLLTKLTTIELIKKGNASANESKGQFILDGVEYQEDPSTPPTEEAQLAFAEALAR